MCGNVPANISQRNTRLPAQSRDKGFVDVVLANDRVANQAAQTILGPAEPKWDAVALVRYPNFSALRKVTESSLYFEKAEPHRKAALKDWEFIATFQPEAA